MSVDSQIFELLRRWEELREQGQQPTPEQLCRDRPHLLDELRRRIEGLENFDRMLKSTVSQLGPPVFRSPAGEFSGSRYRPVRLHIAGGMGEVYRAVDDELEREVALKKMKGLYAADSDSRRRFLREAEVTGRLEHPGIIPVYGMVQDAQGNPCYAMRFVEGETLQVAIDLFHANDGPNRDPGERSLALRQLLGQFVAICNTVAYAHSRGILHRDLKPGNVILGAYGETLVADWGLAKVISRPAKAGAAELEASEEPNAGADNGHTRIGQAMGTPVYMSPEQAAGRWEHVGPATDIYSLGAILYVLLTGQLPFQGRKGAEIRSKVQRGEFKPPREAKAGIPAALEAVCLKAMALKPDARYRTALELAQELEHWLSDEPVQAYRDSWKDHVARWGRRYRTWLLAGGVVLTTATLALAIATGFIARAWRNEAAQEVRAEQAHLQATVQAEREKRARVEAEAAREGALRKALAGYHSAADSCLAEAKALYSATSRPDRQAQALSQIQRAATFEQRGRATLRDFGDGGGELGRTEPAAWEKMRVDLRGEAGRWLSQLVLGRTRTVALPTPPPNHSEAIARSWEEVPPQFHGYQGWLGWAGDIAISPDGSRVAVAYAGGTELLVLAAQEPIERRWPLPKEMASIKLGMYCDCLHFVTNDRIEMSTQEELVGWTWPEGKPDIRRRSVRETEEVRGRIVAREKFKRDAWSNKLGGKDAVMAAANGYTAILSRAAPSDIYQYLVKIQQAGVEPRTVLRSHQRDINHFLFGDDPQHLYLLGEQELDVVDTAQGLFALARVALSGERATCLDLVPLPGGVATLEMASGLGGVSGLRLTLWNTTAGRVWKRWLPQTFPALCLDMDRHGTLVSGGLDNVLRLWNGGQATWEAGISRQKGSSPHDYYPYWEFFSPPSPSYLVVERRELPLAVSGTKATGLDAPASEQDQGSNPLASRPEGVVALYHPDDGRLLHEFPSTGLGRIFSMSPDRRYALVVATERADEVDLEVWSLQASKSLGRLGTYLSRRNAQLFGPNTGEIVTAEQSVLALEKPQAPSRSEAHLAQAKAKRFGSGAEETITAELDAWAPEQSKSLGRQGSYLTRSKGKTFEPGSEEIVPATTAFFSPGGHWLLLVRHAESEVEIWQLPQVKRLGKVPLPVPWIRVNFDPEERRVLMMGVSNEYPETRCVFAGVDFRPPCPAFIRVIDLAAGTRVCDLQDLDPREFLDLCALRFSGDKVIVVLSQIQSPVSFPVIAWDLVTGKKTPFDPVVPINDPLWNSVGLQLQLSPDGKQLLLIGFLKRSDKSGQQAMVQLWDLPQRKLLRMGRFDDLEAGKLEVAADRDCVHFALTSPHSYPKPRAAARWKWTDGSDMPSRGLVLWQVGEENRWALYRGPEGMVLHDNVAGRYVPLEDTPGKYSQLRASLSPDGGTFAMEDGIRALVGRSGLWDTHTGRRLAMLPARHRFSHFDPTGRWLATVDQFERSIRIWDTRTAQTVFQLPLETLQEDPTGVGVSSTFKHRDVQIRRFEAPAVDIRLHPAGNRMALLNRGVIQLWDLAHPRPLTTAPRPGPLGPILGVAQHARSNLVASAESTGVVLIWDRRTGRLQRTLLGHSGPVLGVAFSPDGTRLASAAADGTIKLWQADGQCIWTYRDAEPGTAFRGVAFRPDSPVVAAGASDGRVLLLDVDRQKVIETYTTDGFAVLSLAFSPGGDLLAAGTAGGHVMIWRLDRHEPPRSMDVGAAVPALLFTPGGEVLITGGSTIQFWNRTTGRSVLTLPVPHGPLTAMALDPSGSELMVAPAQKSAILVLDLDALDKQFRALSLELPDYPWARPGEGKGEPAETGAEQRQ
jgi:WD40 repeat protein